jgi:hypothetical protein
MVEYIKEINIPYVENMREMVNDTSKAALAIMDKFKGQMT